MNISSTFIQKHAGEFLLLVSLIFLLILGYFYKMSAHTLSSGKAGSSKIQKTISISDIAGESEQALAVVQDIRSQILLDRLHHRTCRSGDSFSNRPHIFWWHPGRYIPVPGWRRPNQLPFSARPYPVLAADSGQITRKK